MSDVVEETGLAPEATTGEGDAAASEAPNSATPWDKYLAEQVPEQLRPMVLPHMQYVEGLSTKRLQEAAELRKQYEGLVGDRDPETVAQYLKIAEQLDDPEQGPELIPQIAALYGLSIAEAQELADDIEDGQPDEGDDPTDIDALLEERLAERLGPLESKIEAQEHAERVAEVQSQIDTSLAGIREELRGQVDDATWQEMSKDIEQAAVMFKDAGSVDKAIEKGWEFLKRQTSRAQTGLLAAKRGEPGQAEIGGSQPPRGVGSGDKRQQAADIYRRFESQG